MDDELRSLERAARTGDARSIERLERARARLAAPPRPPVTQADLERAFADVPHPGVVSGCTSCCATPEELRHLAEADRRDLRREDFASYLGNLHTVGSAPDLTYLLPALLRVWAGELDVRDGRVGAVHARLGHEGFFEQLAEPLRAAAAGFMRTQLLARIARERSLHVRGVSASAHWPAIVNSLGVLSEELQEVFRVWWRLESEGHAVAAVQWTSALVFGPGENPVFAPWTRNGGGGPPDIADFCDDDALRARRLLPTNVAFLLDTLSADFLRDRLAAALVRLERHPDLERARLVHDRVRDAPDLCEDAILELLANLETARTT